MRLRAVKLQPVLIFPRTLGQISSLHFFFLFIFRFACKRHRRLYFVSYQKRTRFCVGPFVSQDWVSRDVLWKVLESQRLFWHRIVKPSKVSKLAQQLVNEGKNDNPSRRKHPTQRRGTWLLRQQTALENAALPDRNPGLYWWVPTNWHHSVPCCALDGYWKVSVKGKVKVNVSM